MIAPSPSSAARPIALSTAVPGHAQTAGADGGALHIWSLAHGIASLYIGEANGTRRKLPMSPEELLEAGLLIYLQSLGVASPLTRIRPGCCPSM